MTKSVSSTLAWILGVLGPAVLAVGNFLPMIRLKEFGYTYSTVDTPAMLIYGIAVLVFTLNVISVKLLNDIILQLHLVTVALLTGCLAYGIKISRNGVDWFKSTLAYNAPTLKGTNADAYWAKLTELSGGFTTIFGDLRKLHGAYGPDMLYNDVPIFSDTIKGLSAAQAKSLVDAAGLPFDVIPIGIVCFSLGLLSQIIVLFLLRGIRRNDLRSTHMA